jgi:GxxExxY protein
MPPVEPPDIFQAEGYALMGAAFEVFNDRGYGMSEEVYQECLEIELGLRGIAFASKHELICSYKGHELRKRYVPDLLVAGCLVTELKAVVQLLPEHEAQLFNYLRIAHRPVGYLINFGHQAGLQWKRLLLSQFITAPSMPEA